MRLEQNLSSRVQRGIGFAQNQSGIFGFEDIELAEDEHDQIVTGAKVRSTDIT